MTTTEHSKFLHLRIQPFMHIPDIHLKRHHSGVCRGVLYKPCKQAHAGPTISTTTESSSPHKAKSHGSMGDICGVTMAGLLLYVKINWCILLWVSRCRVGCLGSHWKKLRADKSSAKARAYGIVILVRRGTT